MDTFDFAEFAQKMAASKRRTKIQAKSENTSLVDLVADDKNGKLSLYSREELINSLTIDLKNLLSKEDFLDVIKGLFAIEHALNKLNEDRDKEDESLPQFNDFYKALSPILLRALWESFENEATDKEKIDAVMEALRISLEDELYYWQEKL